MELRNWKCVTPILFLWLLKYQVLLWQTLLGRQIFKVTYNDIIYIFNPSFLKHGKAICWFMGILARPKNGLFRNFIVSIFEEREPTSSIYVSVLKDLALLVYYQSNISFSELCKSILKSIAFSKLI